MRRGLDGLITQKQHLMLVEEGTQRARQLGVDAIGQVDGFEFRADCPCHTLYHHGIFSCSFATLTVRWGIVLAHDVVGQ